MEPAWSPAPALSADDPFQIAQPGMSFGEAAYAPATAEAPTYAAAPEAPAYAEAPSAQSTPISVPLQAEAAVEPTQVADAAPAATASPPGAEDLVRLGAEDRSEDSSFLTELLIEVLDRSCSDLHLTVGAPPTVRQNGHLEPVEGRAV